MAACDRVRHTAIKQKGPMAPLLSAARYPPYFAVGITNSAPLGVLSGQRCMMLFCLV